MNSIIMKVNQKLTLPVEPRVKINLIGTGQILVKLQKGMEKNLSLVFLSL